MGTVRRVLIVFWVCCVVCSVWVGVSSRVDACAIQTWDQGSVEKASKERWEGRVSGGVVREQTGFGVRVLFSVYVHAGKRKGQTLKVVYSEHTALVTGPDGEVECPLVSGSGDEKRLEDGDAVRVWVGEVAKEGERAQVLRVAKVLDASKSTK